MALLGTVALFAQHTRKRTGGPRALALLEIAPNGRARLVPISILINGKFYDAGLYRADPRPMALDPETVYEVERSGESVGLFTVTSAASAKDVWIGLGQWRPHNAAAAETASKPAPKAKPSSEDTDEPPVLRKPKAPGTETKPAETSTAPAPTATTTPQTQQSVKTNEPSPEPKSDVRSAPEDPDRPTLRRGKPTASHAEDEMAPLTTEKPGAVSGAKSGATSGAQPSKASTATGPMEILAAISDAGGPEPKSYLMELRPDERRNYEEKVRAIAYATIQKFAATRPQHKPGAAAELHETQFQVYDVNNNNEPVMVMTASLPELPPARGSKSAFQYFATVVVRSDMYGELHQLFGEVTDSTHLDAYPRMELIDAADAEGSGSGQLLFRQVSDTGFNYAIYRVGMDKLWPLFESESKNF